jgi:hypothetical protein
MNKIQMQQLMNSFMTDLGDDEIIVAYTYNYGILMIVTKQYNDNIRYIYNYHFKEQDIISEFVMVDTELLSKAV